VNNNVIELNEANFDREVLNATQPVLVEFWAGWSDPCRAMAPMLESVAEDKAIPVKVARVNVEDHENLTEQKMLHRVGIAADHGGFELKEQLVGKLRAAGHEVVEFGDGRLSPDDDYPDFVVPLARAVACGEVERGVAICGSGVGASVVANKVAGVRACLIHETFSAHQGVEDDDLNMICLGGLVVGHALAWELVQTFLAARFSGAERHRRRLAKVADLENKR
jgi:ribose 5-phosphate isomerase B